MKYSSILITGGCGFVGSNLAISLKSDFPSIRVVCLDNLKRRGSELNINRIKKLGVEFVHGDIRNPEDFAGIGTIDLIIDAAAEPSVLSGVNSTPDYLINTNLVGTINCLNFAVKNSSDFVLLSTSRVYPIEAINELSFIETDTRFVYDDTIFNNGVSSLGITEEFSIKGARSFYGTSKLSAELLVEEYAKFYNVNTIVNRCGVLTGPWQMGKVDQGVVVLWLARHYWKKELGYFGYGGEGKQVRDILHVIDLYDLLKIQLSDIDIYKNKVWNVGGGNEVSVSLNELTTFCTELTGNKVFINKVPENRTADIPWYITDCSAINSISGWKPKRNVYTILEETYSWIRENESILNSILN